MAFLDGQPDPREDEALDIWLSFRPTNETDIANPSSFATLSTTAEAFITYIFDGRELDDLEDRLYGVFHDLIEFCCLHPRSMDWGITVVFEIIKRIPENADCGIEGHLRGPDKCRKKLERFFADILQVPQGDGGRPQIGTKTTYVHDRTAQSMQIASEEVEECPDEVIDLLRKVRLRRWRYIIQVCLIERCHAIETPVSPTDQEGSTLDYWLKFNVKIGLYSETERWNETVCVGLITMLRGSAAYFLSTFPLEEQAAMKEEYIHSLTKLMYTVGEGREIGDKADIFRVKSHAALLLKNLRDGPRNESSAELFDMAHWMF